MAAFLSYSLLLQLIVFVAKSQVYCNKEINELNVAMTDTSSRVRELQCPDPTDIFPCECDSQFWLSIDCSKVESENDLKSIFSKPFPDNYFTYFTIYDNGFLKSFEQTTFGDVTFEYFSVTVGRLMMIEVMTLLGSASTFKEIDLRKNDLSSFPFEELPLYTNLIKLILSDNKFSKFPKLESSTLEVLSMADNPVVDIPADAFQLTPNINELILYSCHILEIYQGTFSGLTNLNRLKIGSNHFEFIPEDTIDLYGSESYLDLSRNRIANFSVDAIKGINKWLYMDHNEFTELTEELFRPLMESVIFFSLHDLPLKCECDIAWLILNPTFMHRLEGTESCANGTALYNLNKSYYEEMC